MAYGVAMTCLANEAWWAGQKSSKRGNLQGCDPKLSQETCGSSGGQRWNITPFEKMTCFSLNLFHCGRNCFFCMIYHVQMNICVVWAFLAFLAFFFSMECNRCLKVSIQRKDFKFPFMSTTCTSMISYTLGRYHHTPTSFNTTHLLHLIPHVFFVFGWKSPVVRYFPRKHLQALRIEGGWSFKSSGKLGWSQPGVVVI